MLLGTKLRFKKYEKCNQLERDLRKSDRNERMYYLVEEVGEPLWI